MYSNKKSIYGKIANFEKYYNFYTKPVKQYGGRSYKYKSIKTRQNDDVNVVKFDILNKNEQVLKSYYLKLYYYDNSSYIKNVLSIMNDINTKITDKEKNDYINKLQISDSDVGKGFYEILFYQKIYNLTKKTKFRVIKPYSYGFFNYHNLNDEIRIDNITIKIKDFFTFNIQNYLDTFGINYYSYIITEYDPTLVTLDYYSSILEYQNDTVLSKNINPILEKIIKLLDFAYKKYKFIHCDLHYKNILINYNLNIDDIKNDDIVFFDFDLSQIGGYKDVGLFHSILNDRFYDITKLFSILKVSLNYPDIYHNNYLYNTDQDSRKKIINIKKKGIYQEIFHSFDYFRILFESKFILHRDWNAKNNYETNKKFKIKNFTFNKNLLRDDIINFFAIKDEILLNKINYKLFDPRYDDYYNNFNTKLLLSIYLYIQINPNTILNKNIKYKKNIIKKNDYNRIYNINLINSLSI